MRYKQLPKVAFRFSEGETFLNGLTSNGMDREKNAFLDRFGKLVALCDQKKRGEEVFLVMEESVVLPFLKHLNPFLSAGGVRMEPLYKRVVHVIGGDIGELRFPQPFGYLTLLDALPETGEELSDEEYTLLRLEHNLPVQGVDFSHEMFLDLGIDAVSFTKGCYLGQEVMARAERMGTARRLARILYASLPEHVSSGGKPIGSIASSAYSEKRKEFLCFALIRKGVGGVDGGTLLEDTESERKP